MSLQVQINIQSFQFLMDEENENFMFSDFQKRQLSQEQIFASFHQQLDIDGMLSEKIELDRINILSRQPSLDDRPIVNEYPGSYIKAYNPMEMIERLAPEKQKQYMRIASNYKNFNGLQFFFETQELSMPESSGNTFLSGINEGVFTFDQEPKSGELNKLFSSTNQTYESEKQHVQHAINQLRSKLHESQQKCFSSIMLNKTIGPAFYEHFQNFSFVSNPSNFYQDLQVNLTNFINSAKRVKGPGGQLIYVIYDFWMKTFKDFVNEIWKYSSKYTLNFLKKQKNSQVSDHSDSTPKKQSLKEKRKNWNTDEIRILEKIVDSNIIFSQNKLKDLSDELGRSINSISSKIQKIIKSKKGQQYQQDSLLKKTIQVLKLSPEGLNKESIIQKINEYYEMGYDGQWQKSVGQLISSRKEFSKIKGKYRLIDGEKYSMIKMDQESSDKLTFRQKVIKCLLKFDNCEADLKSIIQMYISIYGEQQAVGNNNEERRKSIEASISKTLSRYDIFDTSNSKTIYQVNNNENLQKPNSSLQEYEYLLNI